MLKYSYIEGTEEQHTVSYWAIGGFQTGVQSLETFRPLRGMEFRPTVSKTRQTGIMLARQINVARKTRTRGTYTEHLPTGCRGAGGVQVRVPGGRHLSPARV